jgi:hypothetical protein
LPILPNPLTPSFNREPAEFAIILILQPGYYDCTHVGSKVQNSPFMVILR